MYLLNKFKGEKDEALQGYDGAVISDTTNSDSDDEMNDIQDT